MSNNIFNTIGPYANPNNALLNYYATNNANIGNLIKDVNSVTTFTDLFKNKIEGIVSVRLYPFKFYNGSPPTDETHKVQVVGTKLSNTYGHLLNDRQTGIVSPFKIYLGRLKIDNLYNSFLDYGNYTTIELNIPFCASIKVSANECMGKYLHCYEIADFGTGKVTAYIYRSDTFNQFDASETLIATSNGTIGIDIPLSLTNGADMVKNAISLATGTAGSIIATATGNPLALLNSANAGINAMQEHIFRTGAPNGVSAFYGDPYFRAYIYRPVPVYASEYNSIKGKPSGVSDLLSNLTGFTKIHECHLENFKEATKSEIDEVYKLLKEGVIL